MRWCAALLMLSVALLLGLVCGGVADESGVPTFGDETTSEPVPPPLVNKPPLFTRVGDDTVVEAIVQGSPTEVHLETLYAKGKQAVRMQKGASGMYEASIPVDALRNIGLVKYSVMALYGMQCATSQSYTLSVVRRMFSYGAHEVQFTRRVLVKRPWGKGGETFGKSVPLEGLGAQDIPRSIAGDAGLIYLLDTVNSRVLVFAIANGKLAREIALPTATASDIIVDSSTSTLLVIDQAGKSVYKITDGKAALFSKLDKIRAMDTIDSGARFSYDPASHILSARDASQGGYIPILKDNTPLKDTEPQPMGQLSAQIQDQGVIISMPDGNTVRIFVNGTVLDVSEVAKSPKGVVWFLMSMYQDDKVYNRLVRFDPAKPPAGYAWIDTKLPDNTTRRMAAVDEGVVLFEGDSNEGRLVLYSYEKGEGK